MLMSMSDAHDALADSHVETHVLEHLDEDTAQAEHGHGPEHRVALDAQDALDAAAELPGDQHALDPRRRRGLLRTIDANAEVGEVTARLEKAL